MVENVAGARPSGGGFWAAARSWAVTIAIAVVVFAVFTSLVGGPLASGEAVTFTGQDENGVVIDAANLRGKPVVLYVFATWCQACSLTTPTVDSFAERHPELAVVAVAADDPETVRSALKADPRAFRTVVDGTAIAAQLGVRAFPTTIVLDAAGKVTWNRQGVLLPGELDLRTL
jgi:thiol-disulfide isomerase/thioredoxin